MELKRNGVIVVDHGSRLDAANALLHEVCRMYGEMMGMPIVEPAHMELAEPTIAQAFARCVARGATEVVVLPYFLSPGRHSMKDIPRFVAEAAAAFPGVAYRIAEPLGLDPRMAGIMHQRVLDALGCRPNG